VKDASALIITVNFRQDKCTRRFLNSAAALEDFPRCHLSIVDNNSSDDSLPSLRSASAKFANVELLASPQNDGYFGAARWALQRYLENHDAPDWVVICNNDIVFDDPRFLSKLLLRDPSVAGVIAPAIISGITGYDENPSIARRPSRFRMWRYRLWLSNYYLMWFKQWLSPHVRKIRYRFRTQPTTPNKHTAIYAPSGALFIFGRRFFEAGGFIDDGAFLYAEEFRAAEMCRQLRLPVMHDPGLRVWHEGSQSTGRLLTRNVFQHQRNGFRYALSRYNNSYPELGTMPQRLETPVPQIEAKIEPSPAGDRIP
jgi:GT2 family glycosyltransferase